MKIHVDQKACTGHGRCNALAPELYELDDNGYCAVTTIDVAPERAQAARKGADACPEQAITVTE
jgi:ferredoxin